MNSKTILITNDDGAKSPLLLSFCKSIQKIGCKELRTVVPSEEQSWIAQAITRHRPIYVSPLAIDGLKFNLASGTPADCACLGIDNLYADRPDFVFSGINIGANVGLAFFHNSGTVGAAKQAVLQGVPAAAFSIEVPERLYKAWSMLDLQSFCNEQPIWEKLVELAAQIAATLISCCAWEYADLFSVNIPWTAQQTAPIVLTELEETYYQPLFSNRGENAYHHRFQGFQPRMVQTGETTGQLPGDLETLRKGFVSVTPVRIAAWHGNKPDYYPLQELLTAHILTRHKQVADRR